MPIEKSKLEGCFCNCHSAPNEMFKEEHGSCLVCMQELVEEAQDIGRKQEQYLQVLLGEKPKPVTVVVLCITTLGNHPGVHVTSLDKCKFIAKEWFDRAGIDPAKLKPGQKLKITIRREG